MTKRLVDIDDQALEGAMSVLGADTMKETVNRALAEVIDMARRRSLLERLTADGLDLADPETMAGAWE